MSEFYSRAATAADMPFIMGEFEDGARKGHFYEEILTSKGGKTFEKQTRLLGDNYPVRIATITLACL